MGSRLLRVLVLVLGLPAVAWGQVRVAGSATPTAIDVACVSGCVAGGGVTDADDGSVAGGQTVGLGIGLGYGFDGSVWRRISLFGLAGANAQAVAIVDASGAQITSFGGGTQYLNGVANAGPTGTLALGYDGANLRALLTNASGHQYVIFPSAQSVTATNNFLLDATFTARINTLGQKTMVNSTPVVIASDQTSIQVSQGVSPFNENVTQIGGTAAAVNSGNKDNGTLRVVLATDQPQLTNKLLVTPDANSAVNVAQVGGTNVSTLAGASAGTEAGMPVRPITTPRTNTANLTAACSAANIDACGAGSTVELIIGGYNGVAVALTNTGFATTMAVDWTINGSHWVATVFVINATSGTATVPASGKDLQVVLATGTTTVDMATAVPAGAQKVRVRLQTLTTSGTTLTAFIAANTNSDIYGLNLSGQTAGKAAGAALPTLIGGADGTTGCTLLGVTSFPCIQNLQNTAKAIQGPFGLVTQDMKDTGRTSRMFTASVASTATTETLITLTFSNALAATSTCSSCAVTSGKRLRIQTLTASARNSTGTATGNVTLILRAAVAGATSTASPLQWRSTVNLPASAVSVLFPDAHIPDGFEIDANGGTNTFGLTITDPHWVAATAITTFDISIIAYEY